MQNRLLIILLGVFFLAGATTSCDDDSTAGMTSITYYPSITIEGESTIFIAQGEEYTDEGATATIDGEEVDVETTSDVDTSEIGAYTISYSATNSDGFSTTATRYIYVYDPNLSTDDLSGDYTADVTRTTLSSGSTASYSGNPVTLTATDISGVYEISDWIGGYYDVGYDYGSSYAFDGYIQINGDNEVVELSMENAWDYPFTDLSGSYDSATSTIAYSANWYEDSYTFEVTLTKDSE